MTEADSQKSQKNADNLNRRERLSIFY